MEDLRVGDVLQVYLGNSEKIKQESATGFAEVVKGAMSEVGRPENQADASIVDLLEGKAAIGQIMVALQNEDMSMGLVLAVRNEVIQAYREIMNMQF
jgi:flagellar hook-basal body complex protein FliE